MAENLTFDQLKAAVRGNAAAFRLRAKLKPLGDDGDKIFPPTYAGGVYAVEDRRIDGRIVRCVLLDSVQSQANRMEELLQDAFLPTWRELDSNTTTCDLPVIAVHVNNHGWVTSLTAPHRVHDAILRDSNYDGNSFRDSAIGKAIVAARLYNATAFYKYCPTALLFGTWDSTAGEGLESAKVPRSIVSEIVGINVTPGIRTASRIDPLGIKADAATIYRRNGGGWAIGDDDNGWTGASKEDVERDQKGKPVRFGKGGKPSDINHGNVTPAISRFDADEVRKQNLGRLQDILESNPVSLRYDVTSENGRLESGLRVDAQSMRIRDGAIKPGGVTVEYALHTWVLSLTQLRRLRFPVEVNDKREDASDAGRTVLAALGLYSLALLNERGYWLRSRCELIPDGETELELVGTDERFALGRPERHKSLLNEALKQAKEGQLEWHRKIVRLTPSEQLAKLVELSDGITARGDEDADAGDDTETAGDAGNQG